MPRRIFIDSKLQPIGNNVTKVVNGIPKIDGHYWVLRDGVIIDPHFSEYDWYKLANRGVNTIYYPADATTQRMMTMINTAVLTKAGYSSINEFITDYILIVGEEPVVAFCYFNALIEIQKNGGELIMGSFGWNRKDGSKFYEFGGEDYLNVKAFIKPREPQFRMGGGH